MRALLEFFLLTYAVTWTFFITAIAISHGTASTDQTLAAVRGILVFAGTLSPALVALILTARAGGISMTGALLSRSFQWRARARWYLFAVSYMAAIKLTVAITDRLATGSWPQFDSQPFGMIMFAIIVSTPFQSGEEIGWRGYALPRLAERVGFSRGSVLLGVMWAFWHLPLFYLRVPGNDEYGQSFPVWGLGVTALSVAFAWLYTHTNGSLLLTMLMHSAVNNIPHFVAPSATNEKNIFSLHASSVACLTTLLLWIAAAYFLARMRHIDLPGPNGTEAVSLCAPSPTFRKLWPFSSRDPLCAWG
jgi:membrane protease YdiL (CAAX protease family)